MSEDEHTGQIAMLLKAGQRRRHDLDGCVLRDNRRCSRREQKDSTFPQGRPTLYNRRYSFVTIDIPDAARDGADTGSCPSGSPHTSTRPIVERVPLRAKRE